MKKIAFIGGGNMAGALITGMLASGKFNSDDILVADPDATKSEALKRQHEIVCTAQNSSVVERADVVVLTVKPNIYRAVIEEIRDVVSDQLIITVAAGTTTQYVADIFAKPVRIVRSMPNTPAMVRAGMTSLSPNELATANDIDFALMMFGCVGQVTMIKEDLMDVASAIAGSSPALVCMFIEALADGAVLKGMSREQAYQMAAQAVLGSAKMVRDSALHPAQLKDNVASPGGTTIEAIHRLERAGFRAALIDAMASCVDKSLQLSEQNSKK